MNELNAKSILISPELLADLVRILQPKDFSENSTLYHVGYEQAKTDLLRYLKAKINRRVEEPIDKQLDRLSRAAMDMQRVSL